MTDKLSAELNTRANAKTISLFIALYALIAAGILPRAEKRIKADSGGVGPIDLRFSYTPEEVYEMIAAYGEQGRRFYAVIELTMDLIYPFVYATLLALLITSSFRRLLPRDHALQRAHVLPYGVMLADYLENVGVVTMLIRYPARYPLLARITSVFTSTKWIGFVLAAATALVGLIAVAIKQVRAWL
jgi:hypothetical protein